MVVELPAEDPVPSPLNVMIPLSELVWRNTPGGKNAKRDGTIGVDELVQVLAVVNAYEPRRCASRFPAAAASDGIPVPTRTKPDTRANCASLTTFLMSHLLSAGFPSKVLSLIA
jgi:hypothetical protein